MMLVIATQPRSGNPIEQRRLSSMKAPATFVTDIKEIRQRARKDLDEDAVTKNYGGNVAVLL